MALTPRAFRFLEMHHFRKWEREAELHRVLASSFYNVHRGKGPKKNPQQYWPLEIDEKFKESREDYESRMGSWMKGFAKKMKDVKNIK